MGQDIVKELRRVGRDATVDMDNVMCREPLDVIDKASKRSI